MDEQTMEVLNAIHDYIEKQYPRATSLSSVQLGDGFCKWCLTELFELPEETAEDAMEVSGAHDNGIDAFFEQHGHYHVIQTKYHKAHSYEAVAGFLERSRLLLNGAVNGNRSAVQAAISTIKDQVDSGKKVFFWYITNATSTKSEATKLNFLKKDLPSNYRIHELDSIVQMLNDRAVDLPESFRKKRFTLFAEAPPIEIDNTLVMPVRLADLAQFVYETKDFLYHSNIRNYLKRTSINRGIEKTLSEEPENFWAYNNGITIVCESCKRDGQIITLGTPQVVNGCQTTFTVASFLKGRSQRERSEFPGRVLVRIITGATTDQRTKVTRYTNSQNAVKGKDLLSLDDFQRRILARMRDIGYHYEIQRGSFAVLSRGQKMRYRGADEYAYLSPTKAVVSITAPEAVQGYVAAFKQWPHIAYGRPSELMPLEGEYYRQVFNDETPEQPEFFLLPTLTATYAAQKLGYGYGGDSYRRYGRWFFVSTVFATLTRLLRRSGVLNEHAEVSDLKLEHITGVFKDESLTTAILSLVDELILDRYFDDSTIAQLINEDYWNFFKWGCASTQAQQILMKKIDDCLARSQAKSILEKAAALKPLAGRA